MHMIRKGQVRWLSGSGVRRQNRFINELFEVAAWVSGNDVICELLFRSKTCNTAPKTLPTLGHKVLTSSWLLPWRKPCLGNGGLRSMHVTPPTITLRVVASRRR